MWFPNGYLLAMFLITKKSLHLKILIIIIPLSILFESLITSRPVSLIVLFLLANLIETYVSAKIFRHFCSNKYVFTDFIGLGKFILISVLLIPLLTAFISTTSFKMHFPDTYFLSFYRSWFFSAGSGILFISPLILVCTEWITQHRVSDLFGLKRLLIMVLFSIFVTIIPELLPNPDSLNYIFITLIVLPMLLLSSIKHGKLGVVIISSTVILSLLFLSSKGLGPFLSDSSYTVDGIIKLQAYLSGVFVTSLFLGISIEQFNRVNSDLLLSNKNFEQLFKILPYGIQENDLDEVITKSNPAHHHIFGYEDGKLIGKYIWHSESQEEGDQSLKEYLGYLIQEHPKPEIYTTKNFKKDGTPVWLEIKWDYVYNDSGELKGFISIISDVTKRRELQTQLNQSQKLQALGTLIGGVTHEFNNILQVILSYPDLMKRRLDDREYIEKALEDITSAGNRGRDLISQLLLFSRSGTQELTADHLAPILEDIVKVIKQTLPTSIITELNIEKVNDLLLVNANQIHQVILNLCLNAAQAIGSSNGLIQISLSEQYIESDSITISGFTKGTYAKLTVKDNGCGMPPEVLNRIFEPFYTTKEMGEGSGLGLAVVYGIIKQHKGFIAVESHQTESSSGTEFQIFFPTIQENVIERNPYINNEFKKGSKSILLVDDNKTILKLYEEFFTSLGYRVKSFNSSVEVLTHFQENPNSYDLVITDLDMPEIDGITLAKKMIEVRPYLKVILITGYSSEHRLEQGRLNGFERIYRKPIDLASFSRDIYEMLE